MIGESGSGQRRDSSSVIRRVSTFEEPSDSQIRLVKGVEADYVDSELLWALERNHSKFEAFG